MNDILVKKISDKVYLIRVDDRKTRYFEGIWYIPEGVTYNSYLYIGDNRIILFDTVKEIFHDDYIDTLNRIVDIKDIDIIILHHMESDHTGSLPYILKLNEDIEVWSHPMAYRMIKSFYGVEPKFKPLKDLEDIDIGDNRIIIIHTPWLHWPETIMTFLSNEEILFSGDAFGGFSIPETYYDKEDILESYNKYMRKYVATIIGKYRLWIIKNINKIKNIDISPKIIAPAHGIIWYRNVEYVLKRYIDWGKGIGIKDKIVIIYGSTYGRTEEAINIIINRLEKRGYDIKIYSFTEKSHPPISELLGDALDANGFIIGSSTYESGILPTIEEVITLLNKKVRCEKPVLIISSYGWGGVGGKVISKLLGQSGFKIVEAIEFNGSIDKSTIDKLFDSLEKFLNML